MEEFKKELSQHFGLYKVEFEEVRYGMLMMVLCDRWGRVYDVWISFGSVHEVRAFRERKRRSVWFRKLVDTEDKEGKREGMVGKEEKEDSSERQWKGLCYPQVLLFQGRPLPIYPT